MKRIIAYVLALVMCLAIFPMTAFAADSDFEIKDGKLIKYRGSAGHVDIPYGVTSISGNAFSAYGGNKDKLGYMGSITSITIPDSVTKIEGGAFSYTDLKSVTIPDSVIDLGSSSGNVFARCESLESITIGSGVTIIPGYTFLACKNLKSITIPDTVTTIENKAFFGCSSLTSITIGDGVKSIGEYAFSSCKSLTNIELGKGVTSIGSFAFEECTDLKSVTIPGNVTSIGVKAFLNCTNLTSLEISNGVTNIDRYAFQNCSSLKNLIIPASVTKIDIYAFTDCSSLESVTFHGPNTEIGAYAIANPSLKTIYGLTGSKAEKHADWHGYTFVNLQPENTDAPNLSTASSWAHEQINEANSYKLIPESLQSAYTRNITRAEFCDLGVTLYETTMGKQITHRKSFTDTSNINVEKLAGLGVVTGVGDGIFDPDAALTREQAATMLSRLATQMGKDLKDENLAFADKSSASEWAVQAIGRMQSSGIMGGVGDNRFDPHGAYTREQSIATMLRLYNIMK